MNIRRIFSLIILVCSCSWEPSMAVDLATNPVHLVLGAPQAQQMENDPEAYLNYMADRALRQADACAHRAAMDLSNAFLASSRSQGRAFCENFNNFVTALHSISTTQMTRRVQQEFEKQLLSDQDIRERTEAILNLYQEQLQAIARHLVMACDVEMEVPACEIQSSGLAESFMALLPARLRPVAVQAQHIAGIETGKNTAMAVYTFVLPIPIYVDVPVCWAVETTIDALWDPDDDLCETLQKNLEAWTDESLLGTEQQAGFYPYLLWAGRIYLREVYDQILAHQGKPGSNKEEVFKP